MASATRAPEPPEPSGAARRALAAVVGQMVRIRTRLLIVLVLVVAVPVGGIAFARLHERQLLEGLELDMVHQAQLLNAVLADDAATGGLRLAEREPMLAAAARHTRTRIRLLDARGEVVADSHAAGPPEGAEPAVPDLTGSREPIHAAETPRPVDVPSRREVRQALAGHYGAATRLWQKQKRVYLFAALPIRDPAGAIAGVVYVTRSTQPVKLALYDLRTWLIRVGLLAIAAAAIVALFLAATIARPLARLTRIARRIAAGEHAHGLALASASTRRDEIGQLARAFDAMTRELDRRARHASELAADISHELKTPLSGIKGAAEILRDGAADDPAARDRFLAIIDQDAARIDRLVGRLLELSRADADTSAPTEVDYRACIAAAAAAARARAARRGAGGESEIEIEVEIDAAVPPFILARGHLLASALENLLDNAIRHAEPGTPVRIAVAASAGAVRTTVINRGAAISAGNLPRIWDRFFTTRAAGGGTGLGLAIVASAIAAHGGTVGVSSSAGEGTAFYFVLPRRADQVGVQRTASS